MTKSSRAHVGVLISKEFSHGPGATNITSLQFLESVRSLLRLIVYRTGEQSCITQKARKEPTSKHVLELRRVFKTASLLQLRYHARLCLVRCSYAVHETLAELL